MSKTRTRSLAALAGAAVLFTVGADADAGITIDEHGFNALIFGSVHYQNTDFEGRLAAGGSVFLQNMAIGSKLANSSGARDDLIVGGSLQWVNGQVFSGNIRYAGAAALTGVGLPGGSAYQAPAPFDFNAARAQAEQSSALWSGLTITGSTTVTPWNAITLSGAASGLNVFHLSGAALAKAVSLSIAAPTGSTVLINVDGSSASMKNFGFFLSGVEDRDILFNFYEADTLNMSSVGVKGSVFAPFADVIFNNGSMDGSLVASSLTGTGEFHHRQFRGDLPQIPAPGAVATLALAGLALARRRR
ncbi:MAG: choice-of-anchor A family protein [Phycisphaerales bacterium]|nr:MAG: choice-of-anchor A family protein [Phycisphaerales bacterium]